MPTPYNPWAANAPAGPGGTGGFMDWLRMYPNLNAGSFLGRNMPTPDMYQTRSMTDWLNQLGVNALLPMAQIGKSAPYLGYATLDQILASQGKTDPQAMNRLISQTQMGTQIGQQQTQGELARRGLGSSGVGQALAAAQGQAGQNQIAGIRANEAQMAEQRKREDLNLLMQMFINPAMDATAMGLGQYNASANRNMQQQANTGNMWAQIANGILQMYGMRGK